MRTNQAELNSIIERFSSSFREYIDLESPIENIEGCVRNIGGTISNLDAKYNLGTGDSFVSKTTESSFDIAVPLDLDDGSRNVSIAIALGHLLLHMGYLTDAEDWKKQPLNIWYKPKSKEGYNAIKFALAFLMPKQYYIKALNKYSDNGIAHIDNIAKYFHVDVLSASKRGENLGLLEKTFI